MKWNELKKKKKTRQKSELLAGAACQLRLQPTPGFEIENFDSSGFSTEGALISASAVPKARVLWCEVLPALKYEMILHECCCVKYCQH